MIHYQNVLVVDPRCRPTIEWIIAVLQKQPQIWPNPRVDGRRVGPVPFVIIAHPRVGSNLLVRVHVWCCDFFAHLCRFRCKDVGITHHRGTIQNEMICSSPGQQSRSPSHLTTHPGVSAGQAASRVLPLRTVQQPKVRRTQHMHA